jgi:hypothetical protein
MDGAGFDCHIHPLFESVSKKRFSPHEAGHWELTGDEEEIGLVGKKVGALPRRQQGQIAPRADQKVYPAVLQGPWRAQQ